MVMKLDEKQTAVSLGLLFAAIYAAWVVLVGVGFGQTLLNLRLSTMFVTGLTLGLTQITAVTVVIGLLCAFIIGAIIGWVFAEIWNWVPKQKWYKQL